MLERLFGSFPPIIQMLRDDHKAVRALFARYDKADKGEKPQLAHRVIEELTLHAKIEERVVYPALRAAFKESDLVYEAVEEHHLLHVLLQELSRFRPGPGSATFEAKFKVLRELLKHHVDEEEGRLFPKAEAHKLDEEATASKEEAKGDESQAASGSCRLTLRLTSAGQLGPRRLSIL
jgi:hemerythrin-like domain-containing protein